MSEIVNKFEPKAEEWTRLTTPPAIRRFIILGLIFLWISLHVWPVAKAAVLDFKDLLVLAFFGLLYLADLFFSITLSAKASEIYKAFMLQTAVPITAIVVVGVLAYSKAIDSAATITLFGLSLGYTTYVVGKEFKKEGDTEKHDSAS